MSDRRRMQGTKTRQKGRALCPILQLRHLALAAHPVAVSASPKTNKVTVCCGCKR